MRIIVALQGLWFTYFIAVVYSYFKNPQGQAIVTNQSSKSKATSTISPKLAQQLRQPPSYATNTPKRGFVEIDQSARAINEGFISILKNPNYKQKYNIAPPRYSEQQLHEVIGPFYEPLVIQKGQHVLTKVREQLKIFYGTSSIKEALRQNRVTYVIYLRKGPKGPVVFMAPLECIISGNTPFDYAYSGDQVFVIQTTKPLPASAQKELAKRVTRTQQQNTQHPNRIHTYGRCGH